MPHKHKRDKSKNGPSYDLPPSTIAKPLPVHHHHSHQAVSTSASSAKSRARTPSSTNPRLRPRTRAHASKPVSTLETDTPRAFSRLMTGRPPPSGLDDGVSRKRKREDAPQHPPATITNKNTQTKPPNPDPATNLPTLLPSEPLSAFATRVNAALPLSSAQLARSRRKDVAAIIPGIGERQTKMEKRMQRMQAEWRAGAAKRREQRDGEEEDEDENAEAGEGGIAARKRKGKGKKRRKVPGTAGKDDDDDDDDEDPWAAIAAKRLLSNNNAVATNVAAPSRGLVGLHDVVLAPPKFVTVPREKMRGDASRGAGAKGMVPGGLKRREELGEARRGVVEGYRRLMRERRGRES